MKPRAVIMDVSAAAPVRVGRRELKRALALVLRAIGPEGEVEDGFRRRLGEATAADRRYWRESARGARQVADETLRRYRAGKRNSEGAKARRKGRRS